MQSSIVEPLLLFCTHAIRMHDGRCCGVVLRVFRSIVPEFRVVETTDPVNPKPQADFPIPPETSDAIRQFISSDVLKECISSLHDPYFVDSQKDLGGLIASVLVHYGSITSTPRDILLSLSGVKPEDVGPAIDYISRPNLNPRHQRAIVLDLLKDVKGVSISEMGKLDKSVDTRSKRVPRSKMAQEFMTAPPSASGIAGNTGNGGSDPNRKSPDLEGVASMFNEGV